MIHKATVAITHKRERANERARGGGQEAAAQPHRPGRGGACCMTDRLSPSVPPPPLKEGEFGTQVLHHTVHGQSGWREGGRKEERAALVPWCICPRKSRDGPSFVGSGWQRRLFSRPTGTNVCLIQARPPPRKLKGRSELLDSAWETWQPLRCHFRLWGSGDKSCVSRM